MAKLIVTFIDENDRVAAEESVSCFKQDAEEVALMAMDFDIGPYSHVEIEEVKG